VTLRRLSEFDFELGDEWSVEDSNAVRLIAHDSEGVELIASAAKVEQVDDREGTSEGPSHARDRLVANAREALTRAATHPELKVTRPLEEDERAGFKRWVQVSHSKDDQVFFGQLICAGSRSVVILTFEGPSTASVRGRFDGLCERITIAH
jgi:hypothetical protein